MSGGKFEYKQYDIDRIADIIQFELNIQKMPTAMAKKLFPEDQKPDPPHSEEVQEQMRNAIRALRVAAVYAQRVDWYLSGDDGPESFLKTLKSDLKRIK